MLRSQLHCVTAFKFNPFFYKITPRVAPRWALTGKARPSPPPAAPHLSQLGMWPACGSAPLLLRYYSLHHFLFFITLKPRVARGNSPIPTLQLAKGHDTSPTHPACQNRLQIPGVETGYKSYQSI